LFVGTVTRLELEESLEELRTSTHHPRSGILGPRSVAWRLGGDLGVFVGGGRAALLQLAHPVVAHAVDHHSRTRADVLGRFQRTFRNVFAMIFGELDDAFVAARRVHQIHTRVTGTLPHAVGAWKAGTPYAANDADALRWVHATLVDSVLVVRERLGRISRDDRDAYVIEMNRFARLFGIPHALLPRDAAAHDAYMARMIPTLAVAQCAREMAQFLVGRGAHAQPVLGRVSEAVTAQLLPPALVAQFGLRTSRLPLLAAFAPVYRALPTQLVALPAHAEARRRLAGRPPSRLGAWTERQLFSLAERSTKMT
jgi:uncharacterized protein (DUF2236 family)